MKIEIDVCAAEAVFEQIVQQIRSGVQNGSLAPATPLPSIRQLADDLDLNHNTVAKAYKLLEHQRVITTAGRRGTFIHSEALAHINLLNVDEATHRFEALVGEFGNKGLSMQQMTDIFNRVVSAAVGGLPAESTKPGA